jgi:hypothetical protein
MMNMHWITRSRFYPLPRSLIFSGEDALLKKYAKDKKSIVEIGVFEGASARLVRSVMSSQGRLTLIDPFVSDSNDTSLKARKGFTWLNANLYKNGKVNWINDYSYNAVKKWSEPVDLLFIDGDHNYQACLQDWNDWSPFIVKDGIVIFHDARYGLSGGAYWDGCVGPTKVVNELFRSGKPSNEWRIVEEKITSVVVRRNL